MLSNEIIEKARTYGSKNYAPFDLVIVRGEGSHVWDPEGREYLDMLGGYSALNHGHRHPRIMRVAHEQLDKVSVVARCFHNEPLSELTEALVKLTGLDRVMPMNSGAEAVESAIKIVRARAIAYVVCRPARRTSLRARTISMAARVQS